MEELLDKIRTTLSFLKKAGLQVAGDPGTSATKPIEVDVPESPSAMASTKRQLFPGRNATPAALGAQSQITGPSRRALLESYKDDTQGKYTGLVVVQYPRGEDPLPPNTSIVGKENKAGQEGLRTEWAFFVDSTSG
ncbi:hypothetical protein MAPG_08858 [Magnaporthiopsis poae ATCC 64411]|uniref:Uncharacterized protein n=1 Tax=Magnaporthiopsis poae (strain ATCC 64411 / 73-15) TaxID=644358 RepID=A0A0C4E8F7_MAGP6|nr:hypothetical protein MAPG_08858 [Magnaporthiopsis poae ATCC 64411]